MNEPIDWTEIMRQLQAPFPESEIHQRPGRGGMTFDYIDARAVMDRLDEVVGCANWSDRYTEINAATCAVECTLTVHGVSKADVGYPNAPTGGNNASDEPLKDAYSDALKRAGVKWGIGRFLYRRDRPKGAAPRPQQSKPTPRQEEPVYERPSPPSLPTAHTDSGKAATPNQLATIAKLSMLLGESGEVDDSISGADASDEITRLSRIFNERKKTPAGNR